MTMGDTVDFVFRCDAGPRSGAGHFMRQLAVAQRAAAYGPATILVPSEGQALFEQLDPGIRGVVLPEMDPADEAKWILERFGTTAIYIVDSYHLPTEFYAALSKHGRCVAFDDGDRTLPAALTVRPRPGGTSAAGVLEGYEYIPVRRGFERRGQTACGQHLVICFGASDPTGATQTLLSRLPTASVEGWRMTVVRGPLAKREALGLQRLTNGGWTIDVVRAPDMPALLRSADAAVVAAGSIVWELAAIGVPTAAFSVVDNQDRNARWLAEHGCIGGGWRLGTQPIAESADVVALLTDTAWRHSLGEALSERIDGRGASRIVEAALSLTARGGTR